MKNFFMRFLVKGSMILFAVIIIWLIYFILNFIDPNFFNFLRNNKNKDNQIVSTSTLKTKKTLGYRIYDMFFKSNSNEPKEDIYNDNSSTTVSKRSFWDSSSTVVWGAKDSSNVWGSGQNYSQNALYGMSFIYPNTSTSPIRGLKINTLLVNENNFNYLPNEAIITGSIYTGFLDGYYFNADIYNSDGVFLFSIPFTSSHDLSSTESFSNFYAKYNKSLNFSNYKGRGYMIIKSDNQNVSSSVLIKIEFK